MTAPANRRRVSSGDLRRLAAMAWLALVWAAINGAGVSLGGPVAWVALVLDGLLVGLVTARAVVEVAVGERRAS